MTETVGGRLYEDSWQRLQYYDDQCWHSPPFNPFPYPSRWYPYIGWRGLGSGRASGQTLLQTKLQMSRNYCSCITYVSPHFTVPVFPFLPLSSFNSLPSLSIISPYIPPSQHLCLPLLPSPSTNISLLLSPSSPVSRLPVLISPDVSLSLFPFLSLPFSSPPSLSVFCSHFHPPLSLGEKDYNGIHISLYPNPNRQYFRQIFLNGCWL